MLRQLLNSVRAQSRNYVRTDKRSFLCWRQTLSDRHKEDCHAQESRDSQCDFLSRLAGHVEHEQSCEENIIQVRASQLYFVTLYRLSGQNRFKYSYHKSVYTFSSSCEKTVGTYLLIMKKVNSVSLKLSLSSSSVKSLKDTQLNINIQLHGLKLNLRSMKMLSTVSIIWILFQMLSMNFILD